MERGPTKSTAERGRSGENDGLRKPQRVRRVAYPWIWEVLVVPTEGFLRFNDLMKAAVFHEFRGPIEVVQVADPAPPRDGVVVSVRANGICRSDWHGWMGHDGDVHLPHVPGHELAGVIAAVGPDVRRFKVGERVTIPFAVGCGACASCQKGDQQICDDYYQPGFTGWGSFAEYVALPHADGNLVRLPDTMDFVDAASLGCRFVTSFRAVVVQGRVAAGEWVAIHGCGGVGLAAVMIARASGARVVAVDTNPAALELARSMGAAVLIDARTVSDIPQAIADATSGGADLSLDALGSPVTCRNSVLSLRKRGRHVQVGLMTGDHREPPVPMARVIAWELEILGSHGMQAHAYAPMLRMIEQGTLNPGRLVTRRVSLAEGAAFLQQMDAGGFAGVTVIDQF